MNQFDLFLPEESILRIYQFLGESPRIFIYLLICEHSKTNINFKKKRELRLYVNFF